jgi:thioredoxin reductase (NADPH)
LLLGTDIVSVRDVAGRPEVAFAGGATESYDYVVYALGGSAPHDFLKTAGIEFDGPEPVLKDGYETTVPGLFLLGDLSAGRKGGSIIWAFNSANTAMKRVCDQYLR